MIVDLTVPHKHPCSQPRKSHHSTWADPAAACHLCIKDADVASCAAPGAARAVSRRYIADFVSKRERTKASAAFVGSSAMGMALGPLLARLFQSFPTMHLGPLTFNYITMGACAAGLKNAFPSTGLGPLV